MSRRTLILCLATLAVMILGLGVAIAFLYSGTDDGDRSGKSAAKDVAYPGLSYIPSDALLVSCFSRVDRACAGVLSGFGLMSELADEFEAGSFASLHKGSMTVSLHYSGKIRTLYVFDIERATETAEADFEAFMTGKGLFVRKLDDVLLCSDSEALIKSSERHVEKGVSVLDAPGFADLAVRVSGDDVLFVSNVHSGRLMSYIFTGTVARKSSFFERVADWTAFDIGGEGAAVSLAGILQYDGEPDEYVTALDKCQPAVSEIAEVLPSYTTFAVTLPARNIQDYVSAYQSFVDSRQGLQDFKSRQGVLGKSAGVMPEDFFRSVEVKEIANAAIVVDSKVERLNLIRVGNADVNTIFKGTEVASLRQYVPSLHDWAYPGFVASVFGGQFALADESCFTYVDGWIVTGSRNAVLEYVERGALKYTLKDYMADSGKNDLLSQRPVVALAYMSLTEDFERLSCYVKPDFMNVLKLFVKDAEYAPLVFSVGKDKKGLNVSLDFYSLALQKTKVPAYDRDTVVAVPSGPFEVINSHTGKMNTFYQNAQGAICLRDETGKDLWGVPFDQKLCGAAENVDYFANGKLQIAFCAGNKLYIIDRLGRYVTGFPVDLGREVVLGPDVYDFSESRKYNIMVLHKDNTIQMYNLKGKKPEAWKGIKAEETIKALPERLTLGNKDFWVVRTSLQSLIFPFYGGEPLTGFEGDSLIRPDSDITIVDASTVECSCYDGKKRRVKLI